MSFESDDDRLAVLEDDGVDIQVAGRTIIGLLDNGYEDALGTWVTVPVITVRDIDLPEGRDTALTIDSVGYTIAQKEPDGHGISHVILQRT